MTVVLENDRFYKNDLRPFFIRLLFKKTIAFEKKIVFEKNSIDNNFNDR